MDGRMEDRWEDGRRETMIGEELEGRWMDGVCMKGNKG